MATLQERALFLPLKNNPRTTSATSRTTTSRDAMRLLTYGRRAVEKLFDAFEKAKKDRLASHARAARLRRADCSRDFLAFSVPCTDAR
ncbi:hypothetical protein [Caballeronia sp. LZ035]|uniref:hypothetical protein n=1 Tax=Caballeronia sp. LZ035 TaxID=3038568 RepID=UPI00285D95BE|nr:hypothetical protein [Caballeronia sp. LZ035]MDR5763097.1 hypothetical protein [Caballeronia sp. LZ035]